MFVYKFYEPNTKNTYCMEKLSIINDVIFLIENLLFTLLLCARFFIVAFEDIIHKVLKKTFFKKAFEVFKKTFFRAFLFFFGYFGYFGKVIYLRVTL